MIRRTFSTLSIASLLLSMLTGCSSQTSSTSSSGTTQTQTQSFAPAASGSCILHQKSDMSGEQTAWFSTEGARMESKGAGLVYVVKKSPDWTVFTFSDKDKLIYQAPFDKFVAEQRQQQADAENMAKAVGMNQADAPFVKGDSQSTLGLSTTEYVSESKTMNADGKEIDKTKTTLLVTQELPHPPGIAGMLTKGGEAIPKDAVVLRMTMESGGDKTVAVDTTSFERAALPANVFDVPTGYKTVKSAMEVLSGPGEETSTASDKSNKPKDLNALRLRLLKEAKESSGQ